MIYLSMRHAFFVRAATFDAFPCATRSRCQVRFLVAVFFARFCFLAGRAWFRRVAEHRHCVNNIVSFFSSYYACNMRFRMNEKPFLDGAKQLPHYEEASEVQRAGGLSEFYVKGDIR